MFFMCPKHTDDSPSITYSAGTPPKPPSVTEDSEIQNTTQRKSQRLAERQQTLAPQANEQPPKPKGKKRQRPSEYKLHNDGISYCAVQPLDSENRATSLWDYKRFVLRELSMTHLMLLTIYTNTICKLQMWQTITCTSTTNAEQIKQKPKTKSSTMSP